MSEEKDLNIKEIYVALLGEGLEVWKPVKAIRIEKNIYQILDDTEYDEADEKWEFPPGSKVLCESKKIHDGVINAAVKKVE